MAYATMPMSGTRLRRNRKFRRSWVRIRSESAVATKREPFFKDLIAVLEATGADRLYSESDCRKILDLTYLYFLKEDPHVKANGSGGMSDALLDRALAYRKENADAFRTLRSKSLASTRRVILSLILVESHLGKNPGRYSLVSVLLTMAASDREEAWKHLTEESLKKDPTRDREALLARFREKTPKKNAWAAEEVRAVLRLRSKWPDILKLKTSYAGAFGIPQFLPSSYEKYAVTPSTDAGHAPDLFAADDVIYSVGNYLHSFGWNPTSTTEEKRGAVYGYNHSQTYVDLVLDTATKIELRNIPNRLAAGRAARRAAAAEDGPAPRPKRAKRSRPVKVAEDPKHIKKRATKRVPVPTDGSGD